VIQVKMRCFISKQKQMNIMKKRKGLGVLILGVFIGMFLVGGVMGAEVFCFESPTASYHHLCYPQEQTGNFTFDYTSLFDDPWDEGLSCYEYGLCNSRICEDGGCPSDGRTKSCDFDTDYESLSGPDNTPYDDVPEEITFYSDYKCCDLEYEDGYPYGDLQFGGSYYDTVSTACYGEECASYPWITSTMTTTCCASNERPIQYKMSETGSDATQDFVSNTYGKCCAEPISTAVPVFFKDPTLDQCNQAETLNPSGYVKCGECNGGWYDYGFSRDCYDNGRDLCKYFTCYDDNTEIVCGSDCAPNRESRMNKDGDNEAGAEANCCDVDGLRWNGAEEVCTGKTPICVAKRTNVTLPGLDGILGTADDLNFCATHPNNQHECKECDGDIHCDMDAGEKCCDGECIDASELCCSPLGIVGGVQCSCAYGKTGKDGGEDKQCCYEREKFSFTNPEGEIVFNVRNVPPGNVCVKVDICDDLYCGSCMNSCYQGHGDTGFPQSILSSAYASQWQDDNTDWGMSQQCVNYANCGTRGDIQGIIGGFPAWDDCMCAVCDPKDDEDVQLNGCDEDGKLVDSCTMTKNAGCGCDSAATGFPFNGEGLTCMQNGDGNVKCYDAATTGAVNAFFNNNDIAFILKVSPYLGLMFGGSSSGGSGAEGGCTPDSSPPGGNTCFVAGTQITMADGSSKNIEDVIKGEMVLSYDLETKEYVSKKVLYVDKRHTVAAHAEASKKLGYEPSIFTINKGLVEFTPEHPFFVRDNGFLKWAALAPDMRQHPQEGSIEELTLKVGQEILFNGEWTEITSLGVSRENVPDERVYNLIVEDTHNYIANNIVVHNKGAPPFSPGPPSKCFVAGTQITMADGNSKNIEDVQIGDSVLTMNMETMTIEFNKVLELVVPAKEKIVEIVFAGSTNRNTLDHRYYVKDKGWVAVDSSLEVGDIAYSLNGESEVLEINELDEELITYNLKSIKNDNYFANNMLVNSK